MFVKKFDSSLCFCVDYCKFNRIIIKNKYFLSLLLEIFKRFANTKYFIKINIHNIYYYI